MRKIDKLTFSIFIQLKMKHEYFKSYLHRLSENNSNKCYEICNARQTLKHLLLNCRHYRAEQIKLKEKAQLKNTDTILTLFIIKIERIATLEYLKNTWIATRKWLLENERVEREECEETKKNESTMMRIEQERFYMQTIDVIDQREDIKQQLWSGYM